MSSCCPRPRLRNFERPKSSQTQPETEYTDTSRPDSGTATEQENPPIDTPALPVTVQSATVRLKGTVPPEVRNRLGTRILPKLRSGDDLSVGVEFSVSIDAVLSQGFQLELEQALADLGLQEQVSVEASQSQ